MEKQPYHIELSLLIDAPARLRIEEVKDVIRNTVFDNLLRLAPAGFSCYVQGAGITRLESED